MKVNHLEPGTSYVYSSSIYSPTLVEFVQSTSTDLHMFLDSFCTGRVGSVFFLRGEDVEREVATASLDRFLSHEH